ncbi:MAG: hypothetical protein ACO37Y_11905 [Steroidobacteraceae bacterium]
MALLAPNSWNEETRTATIVISTDADVGDGFQLLHTNEAIRWPKRPLPTDYDHKRSSDTIWGAVTNLSLQRNDEGITELIGEVVVDGPAAAMDIALPRLRTGSARFSVDARIYRHREDRASNLLIATDWEPNLVSLVPIGQDTHAVMRGDQQPMINPADPPMTEDLTKAGGDPAPIDAQRSADPSPAPAPVAAADAELQRTASELRRENEILRLGRDAGLTDAQTDELVRSGKPINECSREAIRLMRLRLEGGDTRAADGPAPLGHPARVEVTRDSGDTLLRGIAAGLEARVRPGALKGDDAELGREFRSYTLLELARQYLESRGTNTRGMSKSELVQRGFHSTSDFPLLFSNLAGKTLDAAYAEEPHTWRPIARQRNLPDFKNANDLIVAGALTPEALLEGGEYKAGTLVEGQHTWKLATYARKVTVTRQAIINDDLSALERVPEMLGRGFRRLESNIIWGLITGNAVTSVDGVALFNAAHNNMGGAGGLTISTSGMNTAKKAMRKQTDLAGNTINLTPSYLMVPTDLEATAIQFLFPTGYAPSSRTGDSGPAVNAQMNGIEYIVEPRLDGAADVWYLAASPGSVEGIVFGYLAGEEGPTVTTNEKRDPDGVELLARFDFGAAVKDYRGFYRSKNV